MHESTTGGVGNVQTQFFNDPNPLELFCGEHLHEQTVAYETYGTLNEKRDNAVLLFHALSGSQHAAGFNNAVEGVGSRWNSECHEGWWDPFIGSGRALDTDQFFVICANYLGGCYGSTGPSSPHPEDGKPYGSRFPKISIGDMVRAQIRLIDHLEIEQLHAIIGSSVGGLLALELASRYPDRIKTVVPIATSLTTSPLQRLLNFEQILAIEGDPRFNGGDYYEDSHPDAGLALARRISHKTFVSIHTLEKRARHEIRQPQGHLSWYEINRTLESYMMHQGSKFVERFDANTYLRIVDAWQRFGLVDESTPEGSDRQAKVFENCRDQRYLVFTIDSDVCFYPDQQAQLAAALNDAGVENTYITVHSDKGHDSFLLEPKLFTPHIAYALSEG